jgi:hypothetical protein
MFIKGFIIITISDQTTFASEETNEASDGGIDQVINDLGENF